ncbi:hypothetical protein ACFV2U_08990 [Streptomyces sp. NPDC059697]|uniref:hypothetical protein n=1 Tax=Streptomyces sp. NPDC059697 TaxID=3346912 RepID=UPI0036996055
MRSARMLLATATATAALAIGAPGALAATAGDGGHDDSSYSKEHDKPNGGVHTGGGALTAVRGDDSSKSDSGSDHGKSDSGSDHGKSDSGSDRDKGDSSDSEHGKKGGSDHGKGDDSGSERRGPRGGVHTGGGALSAVRSDDWNKDDEKFDPETYKDKGDKGDKGNDDSGSGRGKNDSDSERDKPRGGMHTGGGALATTGTTAGGLAVLALAGAGVYVVRRRRAADGLS